MLSASDGDLAKAADKLNRDIKRMVPKTRERPIRRRFDKRGRARIGTRGFGTGAAPRRARLRCVVGVLQKDRGRWPGGAGRRRAPRRNEAARRGLPDTRRRRAATYRRERPSKTWPFWPISRATDSSSRSKPSSRRRAASIKGGRERRRAASEKKMEEYGGDFARVVDLERATGVFDSVDDLSLAISLLRAAPPGRHHDPALQGPLRPPLSKWLPRPATERRTGRLCRGAPVESEAN